MKLTSRDKHAIQGVTQHGLIGFHYQFEIRSGYRIIFRSPGTTSGAFFGHHYGHCDSLIEAEKYTAYLAAFAVRRLARKKTKVGEQYCRLERSVIVDKCDEAPHGAMLNLGELIEEHVGKTIREIEANCWKREA